MSIVFVRHGETPLNAARVVQPPETPLSTRGVAQAERLARRLAELPVSHVLASDLPRAQQTAEAITRAVSEVAQRLPPLRTHTLLRERDFGGLCGKPYEELPLDAFGPDFVPEGGESWPVFFERAAAAWRLVQEVARSRTGTLVVVTHGFMCQAWASQHIQLPAGALAPAYFQNTSVSICEAAPPHHAQLLNCTAHLQTLDPPSGTTPLDGAPA